MQKKFLIKFTFDTNPKSPFAKYFHAYVLADNEDEAIQKYHEKICGFYIDKIQEMTPLYSKQLGRFPKKTNLEKGWYRID